MNGTQMDFFNTENLSGEALKQAKLTAGSQQQEIYDFLLRHRGDGFTPFQIHDALDYKEDNVPITSVRRALTNLTSAGLIDRFEEQEKGNFGHLNYKWGVR